MNKADYQMIAAVCSILGIVFVIIGFQYIDVMIGSRLTESDNSMLLSFYAYSSFFLYGGTVLTAIGLGFFWRARRER